MLKRFDRNITSRILLLAAWAIFAAGWAGAGETSGTLKAYPLSGLKLDNMSFVGHYATVMQPGKNSQGQPLAIAGRTFSDGIWMRAHASLFIALDGQAKKFSAWVGVDDEVKGQPVSIKLCVLGDGRELWNSGLMKAGDPAKRAELELSGIKTLVLVALPFSANYYINMADWADARIESEGAAPQTFLPVREKPYLLTPKPGATPRINAPRVYGARPGHPFLFTIPATGERPMRFTAKGLPVGLKLDQATGTITGAAKKAGETRVKITAQNKQGKDTNTLRIVIGEMLALTPPMGWNDWYSYMGSVNDGVIRGAADAMVKSGMINYGYAYVNIDSCWAPRPGADYDILTDTKLINGRRKSPIP